VRSRQLGFQTGSAALRASRGANMKDGKPNVTIDAEIRYLVLTSFATMTTLYLHIYNVKIPNTVGLIIKTLHNST